MTNTYNIGVQKKSNYTVQGYSYCHKNLNTHDGRILSSAYKYIVPRVHLYFIFINSILSHAHVLQCLLGTPASEFCDASCSCVELSFKHVLQST